MRLLLVEDDSILGDAMQRVLQQTGYAVDWARNGKDADLALGDQVYDLVLLDLGLPQLDGFEVLRRLRTRQSSLPVLIVTARDSVDERVKGLDLGADDYVLKPFDMPELLARIRVHLRRTQSLLTNIITYGPLVYDMSERRVMVNDKPLICPARELGILEAMLLKVGKIVSNEQLIEKLCSWDENLSSNAIEVYVHRLRKKLQPLGVNIITVRGLGYMLEKQSD